MRVYISGPISGDERYRLHFGAAAYRLRRAGYEPASPAEIGAPVAARDGDSDWLGWMRTCMRLLATCDGVALLPGWRDSRGAMAEADWAESVGLPVKELEEWV